MNKSLNILVVDDDERLCTLLRRYLSGEGYHVATALNGDQMRRHIEKEMPDLVILDLVLPDADGLLLAQELRVNPKLGIIILTGKGDTVDRIVGLEVGADDYISKPFNNRELLARIHSVLRRIRTGAGNHPGQGMDDKHAEFSGWSMDLAAHELISPTGENVYLTSKEYKLLLLFITSSRRVLSRAKILDHIADSEWNPDDRRIDVLVGKLRKKIEADPDQPLLVKTIRGEGYMFTAQVDYK